MPTAVFITVQDIILRAELFDTPCAKAVAGIHPITARPNAWGDEFFFEVPVVCDAYATATTSVTVGDIGYWPPGRALAIFFGPTPLSSGADPVPASEVNIVGRVAGMIQIEQFRT